MAPLRVLIAGAGIAGLAVRQALPLRGVQADLVERNAAPPATGTWTAMIGSGGRSVLALPLGDGDVYCFAAIDSTDPEPPAGDWRAGARDREAVPAALARYRDRRAGRVRFVLTQNHRRDAARGLPNAVRGLMFRALGRPTVKVNHKGLLSRP